MFVEAPGGHDFRGDARYPMARVAGLIVTESDGELVIYDKTAKHIHHLNDVSAAVWRACDGRRTVPEIAVAASEEMRATIDDDAVAVALGKLSDVNLLVGPVSTRRTSRRSFVKKAAMVTPAVISVTAPLASASASGCDDGLLDQDVCVNGKARAVGRCCLRTAGPGPGGQGTCKKLPSGNYDCVVS